MLAGLRRARYRILAMIFAGARPAQQGHSPAGLEGHDSGLEFALSQCACAGARARC